MFVFKCLRMAARSSSSSKRFVIWETDELIAYLHPFPWTPGATVLVQKSPSKSHGIFQLDKHNLVSLLLGARTVGHLLCERLRVQRCALVSRPIVGQVAHIRLLPLHGLDATWRPHLAEEEDFQPHDPGYCSSKSGPRWSHTDLEKIKARIRTKLPNPDAPPSFTFLGDPAHNSLFSRIVRGEEPQWRVWEDDSHVAFLTPFPNTPGLTVLVPRRPLTSNIFQLEEDDYKALVLASWEVAQLLEEGLGAQGIALIFEGYEINYAHAKLIPLLPPPGDSVPSPAPSFCSEYPGYVTSADGPAASVESLLEMQAKITQT
ncbi:hypothetical protein GN956_G8836 [Arapaima gigas]